MTTMDEALSAWDRYAGQRFYDLRPEDFNVWFAARAAFVTEFLRLRSLRMRLDVA